jgi:hypothetical protein
MNEDIHVITKIISICLIFFKQVIYSYNLLWLGLHTSYWLAFVTDWQGLCLLYITQNDKLCTLNILSDFLVLSLTDIGSS